MFIEFVKKQIADLQEMDLQALCFIVLEICETIDEWPAQDCSF